MQKCLNFTCSTSYSLLRRNPHCHQSFNQLMYKQLEFQLQTQSPKENKKDKHLLMTTSTFERTNKNFLHKVQNFKKHENFPRCQIFRTQGSFKSSPLKVTRFYDFLNFGTLKDKWVYIHKLIIVKGLSLFLITTQHQSQHICL